MAIEHLFLALILTAAVIAFFQGPKFFRDKDAFLQGANSMQSPLDRAREFYHQGETERALKELLPLAKKGDVDAQYLAGEIYCVSDAPAEKAEEYKRAGISWLKSASGQNCDKSMVALARYYEKGEVLEQNIETVGLLLQKAAALGNLEAARRWGRARLFGNFEDDLGQI